MRSKDKRQRARMMVADFYDLVRGMYEDEQAARYGSIHARCRPRADRHAVSVNDPTYRRLVSRIARGKPPKPSQFRRAADAIYRLGQADAARIRREVRSAVRDKAP